MVAARRTSRRGRPRGFTLVELLVTITLVAIVLGVTIPSVAKLFASGATAQASNMLTAQLSIARMLAITEGTYAGVHVQLSDRADSEDCYLAVLWDDPTTPDDHSLSLPKGQQPKKVPSGAAFADLATVNDAIDSPGMLDEDGLEDLTTFTVLFDSTGVMVCYVRPTGSQTEPQPISLADPDDSEIFVADGAGPIDVDDPEAPEAKKLWERPEDEKGATAVVPIEFAKLKSRSGTDARADYLEDSRSARIILNFCTGQPVRTP